MFNILDFIIRLVLIVFKLSQNKTADEQQNIVDALMKQGDSNAVAIAAAMKSRMA